MSIGNLDRMMTQMRLHRVAADERYLQMTRMVRAKLTQPSGVPLRKYR